MLANIEKRSLLIKLATGSCSAIITLASLTADVNAGTFSDRSLSSSEATMSTSQNSGNCLFSAQLAADPALRAAFSKQISSANSGLEEESYDDSAIYIINIESSAALAESFTDSSNNLDKLSYDCLSCHDGVTAQNFKIRVKNNPNDRVIGLENIIGGHPVGMEYEKYVSANGKAYRAEVSFSKEMVFAEGKVGCLTCHNPMNSAKGHLVMNNDRSELCFACHNK
jgi:predicted CXXCH cytochrome family protein